MNLTLLSIITILVLTVIANELRYTSKLELDELSLQKYRALYTPTKPMFNSVYLIAIITIMFVWFCAVRPRKIFDAIAYIDYYKSIDVINFFTFDKHYNTFFELFAKIIKLVFGPDPRIFFAAVALFNCVVVYFALNKAEGVNKNIAYVVYLAMFGIYYSYIVLRQGMALSLVILAITLMKNHKIWSLVTVLLAMLFHESAIFAMIFIIPMLMKKRRSNIFYYVILFLSLFLYFTKILDTMLPTIANIIFKWKFLPESFEKYIFYFTNLEFVYDISIMQLINYALVWFYIYIRPKNDVIYDRYLIIMIFGQLFLGAFSSIVPIVRLVDYCLAANIFLMASSFKRIHPQVRLWFVGGYSLIVIVFFARMVSFMTPVVF